VPEIARTETNDTGQVIAQTGKQLVPRAADNFSYFAHQSVIPYVFDPSDPQSAQLDAMTRERLQDELVDLWSRTGLTVLFVEHNMRVVLSLADFITVLDRGKMLAEGTPAQIAADEAVRNAYLGKEVLDHV